MTVDEIFSKIASHMKEGILYHEDMARAYDFIGIYGYAKLQEYHYLEETNNYKHLSHYYTTHYLKLLVIDSPSKTELIPETWYKYTTLAVDVGTKRSTIKELMNKWIDWEKKTKKFYEEMRQELYMVGEVAAALYIDKYILDVTEELRAAEKQLIELEGTNYDMVFITECQDHLYKKYKKKLGW